jgi:rod shape determining protein RodA
MYQNLGRAINLYFSAGLLTIAGLVTIYSIKPEVAVTQSVFFALAIIVSLIINRLGFDRGWVPAYGWIILVVISLLLTALFGVVTRGSARWLTVFGQQIQTSEFAKIGVILFTASWFAVKHSRGTLHAIRYVIALCIPIFIIFRQPDLGTALMITGVGVIGLLVIGTSLKNLLAIAVGALIAIPLLMTQLKPYQQDRLNSFFNPEQDPLGRGYNAAQATIAVGSGQFTGRGLGQGTQSHLRFLPERHTDFIYASFVEELGFIGGFVILILYLWLCYSLISIAKKTDSITHTIICLLTAGLIFIQALVNIGMNLGIMPITGVTLPFMSYGGSSLVAMYILLGICVGTQSSSKGSRRVFHIQ